MSLALPMLLLAASSVTSTRTVAGEAPIASVRLHLDDCIARRGLVEDLVGIELGFDRITRDDADLEVHTACEADVLRIFIARDHTWGEPGRPVVLSIAERRIALPDVQADGGPRLVALNIAELVQDLRAPLRPPSPPVASRRPSAPAPTTTSEPPASLHLRLGVAPTVRFVPRPGRAVPGARLSVGLDGRGGAWPWTAELDLGFEQVEAAVPDGTLQTRVLSFALFGGTNLAVSDRLCIFAQAGLRGGWVRLAGEAEDEARMATEGSGPWFGPVGGLRIRYGDRLGASVGIEGGWTLYGVYGDAAGTRVGLEGGWLGASLRLDWRFGS